ncbi:TPM domain-containing protein [Pseudonocardia benzenivorans]|uniref:TPM domain-containing protein n=1 Tax=Pseudonocardia benzenivorans TaxID=228005 RepID=UPI0031F9F0D8
MRTPRRSEIPVRRFLAPAALLAALVVALLTMSAGLASADAPLRAADRITDRANALDASGRAQVTDAIARLRTDTGYDLFVVYVRSFDGRSGEDWAHATAVQSQLGARDVLLAVATDDGAYGYSVEDGFPVPVDTIAAEQVEPKLAARDWSGAAVAMANGLRTGGSSGTGALPLVIGGVVIVGGGAWLLTRRRRSAVTTSEATTPAGAPQQPAGPPDPFPGESTEDLGYRSSQALIAVDDAVRTSEQELSAARAHFGEEPVAPFAAALDASRADMLAAFEIRQQLDDDVPEDEPTQRRMHAEILRLATAADERLDAQVEAFDRLRGLEADAPGYVEGVASRVAAATGSVATVEAAWDELRRRWAATSLEPVAGNLDQAKALLADAATEIAEARARLATPPQAVVDGRAAEDAVTQAETLLAGVERRDRELVEAAGRIPAARAEVEQDLAEAATLPSADRAVVARARAALDAAAAAADAPLPDPVAALHLLEEADAALDRTIADAREQQDRDRRTAAALDQVLVTARSAVAAAEDFVTTRRGAIGAQARTRLAEAQRHLQAATAGGDPAVALRSAQQAESMAQQALQLAQADVARWSGPSGGGGGTAVELGSLVLGGILSGALRGGGGYRGGGYGGGFGGGGHGGRSPGSFGGSASRGRRGGGGRF